MIEISCKETLYLYNAYHIAKAFFPNAEIRQGVDDGQEPLVRLVLEEGSCFSVTEQETGHLVHRQEKKAYVTAHLYEFLCDQTKKELSWGILTGIRPTKLIMQQMEQGRQKEEIMDFLKQTYKISKTKAELGYDIALREKRLLEKLDYENGYSLYIGIPFCPSICSYCSFGSSPVKLWADKLNLYVDALCKELSAIAKAVADKQLNTIYIGGGTPTTLGADQLERILTLLEQQFSLESVREFTIEAGRPDSITREKLEVISRHPVTRISINPQTMQQKTLDVVGRSHTIQDVREIFLLARELGFDNINMDLIAGLPGETAEDMRNTLRQIEELGPDSMTIHALSIKRAAKYGQDKREVDLHSEIEGMITRGAKSAEKQNLLPYYLYRQKNIAGNFENVGYAKVDKAGIYNILIMEEKQTILAVGAGASTKIVLPEKVKMDNGKESDIVRIENVKDIAQYIERIDEMIERKGEWIWP